MSANDVLVSEFCSELRTAGDAGHRPGIDCPDWSVGDRVTGLEPTADLHEQERPLVSALGQPSIEPFDVRRRRGRDDDGDHRRRGALELALDRFEVRAPRHEHVLAEGLPQYRRHPSFVPRVQERPEEADGYRIDIRHTDRLGHPVRTVLAERHDYVSRTVDALVHPEYPVAGYEWLRFADHRGIEVLLDGDTGRPAATPAHVREHELRSPGRDQGRIGAPVGHSAFVPTVVPCATRSVSASIDSVLSSI
jgi:hypothetical protein